MVIETTAAIIVTALVVKIHRDQPEDTVIGSRLKSHRMNQWSAFQWTREVKKAQLNQHKFISQHASWVGVRRDYCHVGVIECEIRHVA